MALKEYKDYYALYTYVLINQIKETQQMLKS